MLPTDAGGIRPRKLAAVGPARVGAPRRLPPLGPAGQADLAPAGPPRPSEVRPGLSDPSGIIARNGDPTRAAGQFGGRAAEEGRLPRWPDVRIIAVHKPASVGKRWKLRPRRELQGQRGACFPTPDGHLVG